MENEKVKGPNYGLTILRARSPEWFNELDKQFRQYKFLKNIWIQRQEAKDDQVPGDSFKKDLREFDFNGLKKLCDKYIDFVDREVRMASMDKLEVQFDKKRKKIRYELYQINQLMKHKK